MTGPIPKLTLPPIHNACLIIAPRIHHSQAPYSSKWPIVIWSDIIQRELLHIQGRTYDVKC